MPVTKTRIKYFNEDKIICLVAEDSTANLIRNNNFNLQYTNQSLDDVRDKIRLYLGDIFDFQLPYSSSVSQSTSTTVQQMFQNFISLFPDSYEVLGVDPILYTPDMYDFNNKTMGIITSSRQIISVAEGQNGQSTYKPTTLTHYTSISELQIIILVPVFKESELVDGKINEITDTTFSFCKITYGRTSRYSTSYYLYLQSERVFPSSIGSILNYFADTVIPPVVPPPVDPYNPGGYSGSGGGPAGAGGTGATGTGGLHDDTSDPIPTPNLPSSIATGSGLFTAYNPDASQLAYFANKLWNADPTTIGDLFRLLFGGDAFNSIIGLHLIPVQPDTSGTPNIMLGNWDSGAPAPKIVNQYKQVPFGSLMLPEYWGNSIDYSPYTRIQLALPYIGIVDVDTDDVLGSNNTLTYNIDVLSGAICATLHCVKGNLNSVIYQWGGSCAVQLPITGASFNSIMGAIAGVATAVGGAVAFASGPMGAALGTAGSLAVGSGLVSGSAANMFGSMKGKIQKSGGIGANSGALGIMTPYFIITRPVQSVPETWQVDKGYPSNISAQLGTLTGYTEVSEINLECSGTEAEKKEIIDLLKKGVLF